MKKKEISLPSQVRAVFRNWRQFENKLKFFNLCAAASIPSSNFNDDSESSESSENSDDKSQDHNGAAIMKNI